MGTLVVIGILFLIFIAVMVYSYFSSKKIPPSEGQLGRTAAYLSPFTDSKHSLPDSQTRTIRKSPDVAE
jgi:hypothetical protein